MHRTTVRLPPELVDAAKKEGKPLSKVIEAALRAYLKIAPEGERCFNGIKSWQGVLSLTVPEATIARMREKMRDGRNIDAIKLLRESQGLGLWEAKQVLDTLLAEGAH